MNLTIHQARLAVSSSGVLFLSPDVSTDAPAPALIPIDRTLPAQAPYHVTGASEFTPRINFSKNSMMIGVQLGPQLTADIFDLPTELHAALVASNPEIQDWNIFHAA